MCIQSISTLPMMDFDEPFQVRSGSDGCQDSSHRQIYAVHISSQVVQGLKSYGFNAVKVYGVLSDDVISALSHTDIQVITTCLKHHSNFQISEPNIRVFISYIFRSFVDARNRCTWIALGRCMLWNLSPKVIGVAM